MTRPQWFAAGILLLAVAAAPAAAQGPRFHPGVTAGVIFASWYGDNVSGVDSRTGFYGGGTLTMGLSHGIDLQGGAIYSMEGVEASGGGGKLTIKVDYLRIPVYLRAGTTLQGSTPIRPYVFAGPAIGFEMSCKVKASSGGTSLEEDCNDPAVAFDIRNVDFGLHFGGGVEVGRLGLTGRYQLGLNSADGSGSGLDFKNKAVAIGATFSF
jgi:hypothetical protein